MIVRLVTTGDDSSAVRHAFGGALAPSDIREGTAVSRGISHSNFKHHVSFCIVLGMVAIDTLHSVHTYSSGLRHAGSTSGVVFNPKNLRLATAQLPDSEEEKLVGGGGDEVVNPNCGRYDEVS